MGFIESLRQEQAAEALRKQQLIDQQKSDNEAKRQTEAVEREFHLQRKDQAGAFRQASGIGTLVRALGEIIGKEKFLDHTIYNGPHKKEVFRSRGQSIGPDYVMPDCLPIERPGISLTDPDSTLDIAVWDRMLYSRPKDFANIYLFVKAHFFAVETRPDGNVVIHTDVKETIKEQVWRSNPSILDEALGKAFHKPGTFECGKGERQLPAIEWMPSTPGPKPFQQ